MKRLMALLLLTIPALLTGADALPGVTYISHDKVAAAIAKGDRMITTTEYRVQGGGQVGSKEGPEVHEKITHIFYVIDGGATMITGGSLEGSKEREPGQLRGTGIKGGQAQVLSKGDVIVIPAGTPHWWKDVPQAIHYYAVNVLKP
jgi:mannose-6-phosphate isomerase-like protein (cupin superfamily)